MNIFDRLPSAIFNPLTGKNNRRTWDLLVSLYSQYFNADAVPEFPEGDRRDTIVKAIERFLLDAEWENEEGDPLLATPLVVQANQILNRLVETGWFAEEKTGLVYFISMRPAISRMFDLLQQYSIEGPQLLGGNVLLIYNQLKGVLQDPRGQVSGFVSAAHLCVQLINSLSATTVRTKDLMKELASEDVTATFVRRFFAEHIGELYVRDFKQLRTENHPLRLRYEILDMVSSLETDERRRAALLCGYSELPGAKEGEAEEALELDVRRFRRLIDVEKFLDRMDSVIDAATRRAIASLGYRLKASERIEEVLLDTARALVDSEEVDVDIQGGLFTIEALVSGDHFRLPHIPTPKPSQITMQKREMTPHEKARRMLRKAMIRHRESSPAAMKRYVTAHIKAGESIKAENMPITSVEDAVAFLTLLRLASITTRHPTSIARNPLLRGLGFSVDLIRGERIDSPYFNTQNFSIRRDDNAS